MKLRDKIADFFGYRVINKNKNHIVFADHFREILRRYRINCVFDVGANRGQYGRGLRAMGYRGRIISFEPVSETFCLLERESAKDPLWDVYNYALGSKEMDQTIKVTKNSDLSSFLEPGESLQKMFAGDKGDAIEKEERVMVKTLDAIFNNVITDTSELRIALKMDTQGYELDVFKGAEKSLDRISVLQSELANIPLYQNMSDYLTVLNLYTKKGFEVTGFFPESRNMDDLRVIEFNCVMVKKNRLVL